MTYQKQAIINITLNAVLISYILFIVGCYLIGTRLFIVTSNSMAPTMSKGDLAITVKNNRYQVNDIISFKNKGKVITHRIVSMNKNMLKTKGDVNKFIDFGSITNKEILGKVKFIIPFIGFLILYLQSKYFAYFMMLLIMYFLVRKVQNVKK